MIVKKYFMSCVMDNRYSSNSRLSVGIAEVIVPSSSQDMLMTCVRQTLWADVPYACPCGFKSWTSCSTTRCFGFLICKMVLVICLPDRVVLRIK